MVYCRLYTKEKGMLELTRCEWLGLDTSKITYHRPDGPAVIHYYNIYGTIYSEYYYINGKEYSEEDYYKQIEIIKNKANILKMVEK